MRYAASTLLAGTALLQAAPALAAPGNSHTVTGNADVSVVEPIGVQPVADLRFGRTIQPTTGGTLTVTQTGAVTETGGVTGNAISTPQTVNGRGPGAFAVFGDPNRFFLLFLPNSTTVSNGTATMTVDQFRANTGIFGLQRFNNTGYAPILVGARLSIDANQQVGSYSGQYTVTVLYL
jgi:hypothetical protein